MIVVSFLLVLASLVLLIVGVLNGALALVVAAIVVSVLAAVALVVAVRQRAVPAGSLPLTGVPAEPVQQAGPAYGDASRSSGPDAHTGPPGTDPPAVIAEPSPPPDEPAAEPTAAIDVQRLAGRGEDVLVIDGRPRYHLPGCSHLLGRQTVPLPVSDARTAGFTPCALCTPDRVLLGGG